MKIDGRCPQAVVTKEQLNGPHRASSSSDLKNYIRSHRMSLIEPHGGTLIDREAHSAERESLLLASAHMPGLTLNAREEADLELIVQGALSPLEGFMGEADYVLTRNQKRLADGSVWTIPVTLSATEEERAKLKIGDEVALRSRDGRLLAVLHLAEIFKYDKRLEAERVYLTHEEKHPGVKVLYAQGDYLFVFFFHAEDGIRGATVTGVQTCALPISGLQATGPHLPGERGEVQLGVDLGA